VTGKNIEEKKEEGGILKKKKKRNTSHDVGLGNRPMKKIKMFGKTLISLKGFKEELLGESRWRETTQNIKNCQARKRGN